MARIMEVNIDGMIGPSHHFGGLGVENKASEQNQFRPSHPKHAALEGLGKMELLASLGVPQFFLPPPSRPAWSWLGTMGFHGEKQDILKLLLGEEPRLLSAAYSSAFMWMANAATTAASTDTKTGESVFKIANLTANLHRSIEANERYPQLKEWLRGVPRTRVLEPLFPSSPLRDEGAANVMRFANREQDNGVFLFVYGEDEEQSAPALRKRKPRQTKLASRRVARSMEIDPSAIQFACQSIDAIDAGVFHNDVIATSHENLFLYHERAFVNTQQVVEELESRYTSQTGDQLITFAVEESELSLSEAVDSYLFNSQIVTESSGGWHLIAPQQCQDSARVQAVIQRLQRSVPRLANVTYVRIEESMANGGGPACLRLRAYFDASQIPLLPAGSRISVNLAQRLRNIIQSEYPENLTLEDLARLEFAEHCEQISQQIGDLWSSKSFVSG